MLVVGVLGLCLAQQVPFGPPDLLSGTLLTNHSVATLDVNRDGSPELFSSGVLALNFFVSTDENGALLKSSQLGWFAFPNYPASATAFVLGVGSGQLTADSREDLILVSTSGTVQIRPNAGGHRVDASALGPAIHLDFFGPSLPLNPPFVRLVVPVVRAIDANGDGLMDVMVAAAPIDIWTGTTLPGFLKLYLATGGGAFQAHTLPLPGNVIDAEWADLDSDGDEDTIVFVVEQGSLGAFGYELHHAAYDAVQGLHLINAGQGLPPRVTSLEIAHVLGGPAADYVFSVDLGTSASVMIIEGTGTGQMIPSSWDTLAMPANPTSLPAHVLSVQVEDFDRDGHNDMAAVRHFIQPQTSGGPLVANAELLVAMGPQPQWAVVTTINLGGYIQDPWSASTAAFFQPMASSPDLLHVADWSLDRTPDLYVASVYQTTGTTESKIAVMKNTTPPVAGSPGFYKLGHPSGGAPGYPARAGFDGLPILGNAQFGATIANVRGGSIVGLVWSPIGSVNLFQTMGVDVHINPVVWGGAFVVPGTAAGEGFGFYPLPLPVDPQLLGDFGFLQWAYLDPVAGVFGGTQATQLYIAAQ